METNSQGKMVATPTQYLPSWLPSGARQMGVGMPWSPFRKALFQIAEIGLASCNQLTGVWSC
jgi:hypothetical protein